MHIALPTERFLHTGRFRPRHRPRPQGSPARGFPVANFFFFFHTPTHQFFPSLPLIAPQSEPVVQQLVWWCSWLSRQSNSSRFNSPRLSTLKVSGSSPG
ncbi:hypothetical protein LY78DRAFT_180736 [Colletotrichum sublineola]|nr:hypothetical protein LY78DRAFT_180736 [Colletotrichum sublineola]